MIHPVDKHIGTRIRNLRKLSGVSQQELAEAVGVRFQQIQKYEIGMNRVSASRLWEISNALSTDITYFFENADAEACRIDAFEGRAELFIDPEAIKLVRAYFRTSEAQRRSILSLICTLSPEPDDGDGDGDGSGEQGDAE